MRAILSAKSQTRQPDEIIVVDDASTDGTKEVLAGIDGIVYIRNEDNLGASGSRNRGVSLAKGDWIAFLDSDDVWVCNKLEVQFSFIENSGFNDGLLCSGIIVQEASGKVDYHGFDYESPTNGWTFSEFQTYPFSTPTWVIKKGVFESVGGFDEGLPNCEDLDLLARLNGVAPIKMIPDPMVVKFNQTDSIDADLERVEFSYTVLFDRHSALWKASPRAAVRSLVRLANMRVSAGQLRLARRALIKAMAWSPFSILPIFAFAASLFGSRVYQKLRAMNVFGMRI